MNTNIKRKLLIVNNNMHIGGVQKALVNLLRSIHDKYDVTLLLFSPVGAYMKDIPEDISVMTVRSHYKYFGMSMGETKGNLFSFIARSTYAVIAKVFGRKCAVSIMNLGQKKILGFDVAVSFLHNAKDKVLYGGCSDFVLNCVDAPKKAVFLHCDYVKCGANTPKNAKHYAKFDVIAACSDGCRNVFTSVLPHLSSKTVTVRNCHDFKAIRELAKRSNITMEQGYINIVTVARLSGEKGVIRAIEAIASLKEKKDRIRYYIIGDGSRKDEIKQSILEKNLSGSVIMCGALSNPYGYMEAADILLIPSYEEAAPMVIDEAASLGTPVLSTLTSSAEDMILKRGLGWVCENSEEGLALKLTELINSPTAIEIMKQDLNNRIFNNNEAIKQFNDMIG